jgi:hypothetical protein
MADTAISAAKDNDTAGVERLFLTVIAVLLGYRQPRNGPGRSGTVNRTPSGRFQPSG